MKIVFHDKTPLKALCEVISAIEDSDTKLFVTGGSSQPIVYVPSGLPGHLLKWLEAHPAVKSVELFSAPYKLASREYHSENTVIYAGDVPVGSAKQVIIAGPCAVENEEMLLAVARSVKAAGATILRGGAFKPRSSPYSFRGLGERGLEILALARKETGLPVVTEVVSPQDVELVAKYADILQVGSRNMQNFSLLEGVGATNKPVLLKRGLMSTIEELLMSAEYVISSGNPNVILCERGIRTFEQMTRNTLDISAIAVLKDATHLPVIMDPSHATGNSKYVRLTSRAGIAADADGLMIEVHNCPEKALCDGKQSVSLDEFSGIMKELKTISSAIGRGL